MMETDDARDRLNQQRDIVEGCREGTLGPVEAIRAGLEALIYIGDCIRAHADEVRGQGEGCGIGCGVSEMDERVCDNGGCGEKAKWTEICVNGPEVPFVFCDTCRVEREAWMLPGATYEPVGE